MKKILLYACSGLLCCGTAISQKTIKGNLFGQDYTFNVPSSSGNNTGSGNSNAWHGNNTPTSQAAPLPKDVMDDAYKDKGREKFNKALEYWNKDWDKVISLIKKALVFDPDNVYYQNTKDSAIGHSEWQQGVRKAEDKKWKEAVKHYKKALEKFPGRDMLKQNIIGCNYLEVSEEAEKYFKKGNWIYAAAYYKVLMKNFDEKSSFVIERYAQAYSKVTEMPASSDAFIRMNAKVEAIKKNLDFVNKDWD